MSFINGDFMLQSNTAKKLYHDYAERMPIIDYHCHLSPRMIAENHRFKNITELFLGGDHYKWRVLRTNGVDEEYITGDAPDYDKFLKFAETLPYSIGNPIFHWTQLELKRYFDIDEILSPKTADMIWEKCNGMLKREDFRAKALIQKSNVHVICTTDDPLDDLKYHKQLHEERFEVKVYPTFRPDKAVEITKPTFLPYMQAMGVASYQNLKEKLVARISFFAENGCRLADHAMESIPFAIGNAEAVFDKVIKGITITEQEQSRPFCLICKQWGLHPIKI